MKLEAHLQTSQYSVRHHSQKLLVTQAVVSIHVKEFEHCVQNILWQLMARGDLHSSLKLGWVHNKERMDSSTAWTNEVSQLISSQERPYPFPQDGWPL